MSATLSRIILYLAVMFLPFLGVATFHLKTQDVYLYNPGRCFAQLAFAIMLLQVVLACRLHPSGKGK